jgi:hypothetical protein
MTVRMRRVSILIFLISLLSGERLPAQISPGKLASAHAKGEGIEHCTACHTIGKELLNTKCLDCHTEIDRRVKNHEGYHATVASKPCAECHSEHHGRDFQIVHFDTASFDHASIGFRLEGKHAVIGCRACHATKNIVSSDIQKFSAERKQRTYLGLSTACKSCHEDQHKGQFTKDCSSCHTSDRWKPASKFSHDQSRYPLTGKHRTVECNRCHDKTLDDGKAIRYTNMAFSTCNPCHSDPHREKFQQACSTCHTTEEFHRVVKSEFDHAKTRFPLEGKHASLKCSECHQDNPKVRNASGELGYHITKFQRCSDCHADAHAGQFLSRPDGGKCESCHTVDGFEVVRFTITDHESTRFPLHGSHAAVACISCHPADKVKAKSTMQFRWKEAIDCVMCHTDVHKAQFAGKMPNGCTTCHTTVTWKTLTFSHENTQFPLRGKHAEIACSKCHTTPSDTTKPVQYTGLTVECSGCHKDEHEGQFEVAGFTECKKCHTAVRWNDLLFNHELQSRFVLTGAHERVPCAKCHMQVVINRRTVTKYKPLGTQCVDCHTT